MEQNGNMPASSLGIDPSHLGVREWHGELAGSHSFAAQPSSHISCSQHHGHRLRVHGTYGLVRLARKEGEVGPLFAGPPDACKCKQRIIVLMQAEPDLALTFGRGVRLSGPFTEAGHRHDAAPLRLLQGAAPEGARKIADIGDRPAFGCGRARKAPLHHLKLQPRVLRSEHRCGLARVDVAESWQVGAIALERAEHTTHLIDRRCHAVQIAHRGSLSTASNVRYGFRADVRRENLLREPGRLADLLREAR